MALQLKLAPERQPAPGQDALGRAYVGYRQGLTQTELWERAKGTWKANAGRVLREETVEVLAPDDTVLVICKITGVRKYGDRVAVEGDLLFDDPQVGARTRHPHSSRNPVAYI